MHFALWECPKLGRNRSETVRIRPKPPVSPKSSKIAIDHGTRIINKVSLLWVLSSVKFYSQPFQTIFKAISQPFALPRALGAALRAAVKC